MTETANTLSSTIHDDDDEEEDIDTDTQRLFQEFLTKLSSIHTEQTTTASLTFQNLLNRFQQVGKNDDNYQDRIYSLLRLYNEFIDNLNKATANDNENLQKCVTIIATDLSDPQFMDLLKKDEQFAHKVFFELFDILAKPVIIQYLDNDQHLLVTHKKTYRYNTNLLLMVATATVTFVPFTSSDVSKSIYAKTFTVMYKRVESEIRSLDSEYEIADSILAFLWNLSDRTIVVPWFLDIGLSKSLLDNLKMKELSPSTVNQIISILHNISRHDDGADEIIKLDGLSTIKNVQCNYTSELSDETKLVISMIIALLSTPEQIRSDNRRMNKVLNQLLQITINAAKAERHRDEGFHVSEPLAVFTKLFVDDHSLEYVLCHAETDPQLTVSSTIARFVELLIEFRGAFAVESHLKQFTCIALLNILWSISFHDRYKTKLLQHENLLKTIKTLAMNDGEKVVDQYVPRSMESMAKAANGILYNLNETSDSKEPVAIDIPSVPNISNEKPMIMISYAHANDSFCDRILAEFQKHRNIFGIWIDRDHLASSDDLWEQIAHGITQSNLVVCLLSQDYYNSKSCRKEMNFAVQRKKSMLPIYIGEPGDCDWIDIHIAGLKYVRFKDNSTALEFGKVQELLRTIQSKINELQTSISQQRTEQHTTAVQPQQGFETIRSLTFDMKKPPEEWTPDDIHNWFSNHKVPDALVKVFDFQSVAEMHKYVGKLRADPEKEFNKYEQRYAKHHAGDELEEYVFDRFKNAILNLPPRQSEPVETLTITTQPPTPKSSACIIS